MKTILLMILALTSFGLQARDGNEGGGGGGGVCTPKKCMTLAQAGLRIDTATAPQYKLPKEVFDELKKIINSLPDYLNREQLLTRAIGDKETFIPVAEMKPNLFKKFKEEYRQILSSTQFNSNFELLAASNKRETYLLPGFEKLDVRGKALLLIHEALIRYGTTVINALAFDGHLVDYLAANERNENQFFDAWPFITSIHKTSAISTGYAFDPRYDFRFTLLKDLMTKQGSAEVDKFCSEAPQRSAEYTGEPVIDCTISRIKALELDTIHPSFSDHFSDPYRAIRINRISFSSVMQRFDYPNMYEAGTPYKNSVHEIVKKFCQEPNRKNKNGYLMIFHNPETENSNLVNVLCDPYYSHKQGKLL